MNLGYEKIIYLISFLLFFYGFSFNQTLINLYINYMGCNWCGIIHCEYKDNMYNLICGLKIYYFISLSLY